MDKKIIVAIDGHSSCGKSTMAKALAREVGYIYIDTGAMYRGVTLAALRAGLIDAEHIDEVGLEALLPQLRLSFRLNADGLPELYLGDERVEQEIRTIRVSNFVSPISAIPAVREALTKEQQRMGANKGVVMDGRDIGTNVFPEAELKIFVTADPKVRAQRRLLELREKGDNMTTLEEVLANVESRDYADSHRAVSPLRQAEDAVVLDNTHLTHQQQSQKLSELFAQAVERLG